jgi:hypothetical protein
MAFKVRHIEPAANIESLAEEVRRLRAVREVLEEQVARAQASQKHNIDTILGRLANTTQSDYGGFWQVYAADEQSPNTILGVPVDNPHPDDWLHPAMREIAVFRTEADAAFAANAQRDVLDLHNYVIALEAQLEAAKTLLDTAYRDRAWLDTNSEVWERYENLYLHGRGAILYSEAKEPK